MRRIAMHGALTRHYALCIVIDMDGQRIRKARERLGESQEAFGQRCGVDQATISRWETEGIPERGAGRKIAERVLAELRGAAA